MAFFFLPFYRVGRRGLGGVGRVRDSLAGRELLDSLKWKVGHSNDWERRQREYAKCNVGQTHIWVCRWDVEYRYYCGILFFIFCPLVLYSKPGIFAERLARLEQRCVGGEPVIETCVCGVRHREYFNYFHGRATQPCLLRSPLPPRYPRPYSPFLHTNLLTLHIISPPLPDRS